jgi:hypothetical protein
MIRGMPGGLQFGARAARDAVVGATSARHAW